MRTRIPMRILAACLALGLALWPGACGDDGSGPAIRCLDGDGDGFGLGPDCRGPDCDDRDSRRVDNCELPCDDFDGDGFGVGEGCLGPDCLDGEPEAHPGALEICDDGLDNDCVGGDAPCVAGCIDEDGDGYGEGADCIAPDCDDDDREVYPGATERCSNGKDDDCAGNGDTACAEKCDDGDGDLHGDGPDCLGSDCNDRNPAVNSSAEERCDFIDNDCDGETDECPGEGQVCGEGNRCRAPAGGQCSRAVPCNAGYTCDELSGRCLGGAGASCSTDQDCLDAFSCDINAGPNGEGRCTDDACAQLQCEFEGRICDPENPRCVDCLEDGDCGGGSICNEAETCIGPIVALGGRPRPTLAEALVGCWRLGQTLPDGQSTFCFAVDARDMAINLEASDYEDWICDVARPADFPEVSPDPDTFLDEARDLAGCGLINDSETRWDRPIPMESVGFMCIWYAPRAFVGADPSVRLTLCADLPEDLQ